MNIPEKIKELKSINESHRKLNGELRERIKELEETIEQQKIVIPTKEEAEYFFNRCYKEFVEFDVRCNCENCQKDRKTIAKLQKIIGGD